MSTTDPKGHSMNLKQLKRAITAAGATLWTWNVDTDEFTMDDPASDLWEFQEAAV